MENIFLKDNLRTGMLIKLKNSFTGEESKGIVHLNIRSKNMENEDVVILENGSTIKLKYFPNSFGMESTENEKQIVVAVFILRDEKYINSYKLEHYELIWILDGYFKPIIIADVTVDEKTYLFEVEKRVFNELRGKIINLVVCEIEGKYIIGSLNHFYMAYSNEEVSNIFESYKKYKSDIEFSLGKIVGVVKYV